MCALPSGRPTEHGSGLDRAVQVGAEQTPLWKYFHHGKSPKVRERAEDGTLAAGPVVGQSVLPLVKEKAEPGKQAKVTENLREPSDTQRLWKYFHKLMNILSPKPAT